MSLLINGVADRKVSLEIERGQSRGDASAGRTAHCAPRAALLSDRRVTASRPLRLRRNAGVTAQWSAATPYTVTYHNLLG
jgi:hypothetical protein